MTRALYCSLLRLLRVFLINALNLDPKRTWDGGDIATNLFDQKDMDENFINEVVLKEYTDEQLTKDCNKIIVTANDIKNNPDKYAQVILKFSNANQCFYTKDPELIAFSSQEKRQCYYT